jgi:hypothetical protein
VKDVSGNVVATTVSQSDGTYAVTVPGTLAVSEADSAPKASLMGDSGSGLVVESIAADTKDGSVLGIRTPIDFSQAKSGALQLGKTAYAKITAIRGKATIEGTRDATGISVYIPGTSFAARTNAAGEFLMTFIMPGNYDLRFERDGYIPVDAKGIVVTDSETTMIPPISMRISGGATNISVRQVGTPGTSRTLAVEFFIDGGSADRFKGGLPSELETLPYGPVLTIFKFNFPADGTYTLRLLFADSDGFETVIERVVVVDTTKPSAVTIRLADRSSLVVGFTNESFVLAYHPTCHDIAAIAILPAGSGLPRDSDFSYECYTTSSPHVSFSLPAGLPEFAYRIWARDAAGNVSDLPAEGTILVDTTAPIAPAILFADQTSGSITGTDITTVNVSIQTCADIDFLMLSESQTVPPEASQLTRPCSTVANSGTYTFATNIQGQKTIFVWAIDRAGNVGQVAALAHTTLDYTAPIAPTFSLADPTPLLGMGQSNSLTLDAIIAHCTDVTHVLLSESASSPSETAPQWQECTTASPRSAKALADGFRTIYLWAKDIAGNISAISTSSSITVNSTAPNFNLADPTPDTVGYSNTSSLAARAQHCNDVTFILIKEGQSSAPSLSDPGFIACTTSPVSVNAVGSGVVIFYLWAKYSDGTLSGAPSSQSILLDQSPPTAPSIALSDVSSGSSLVANVQGISVSATCGDSQWIYLSESTSAPSPASFSIVCVPTVGFSLANAAEGGKTVYAWGKDAAGNVSASYSSSSITMDTTPPALPLTFTLADPTSASSANTNDQSLTFAISSCEAGSSMLISRNQSSQPSEGAGGWQTCAISGTASMVLDTTQGVRTVYLWLKDVSGNVTATSSFQAITFDNSSPSAPAFSIEDDDDGAQVGFTNTTAVDITLSSCADIAAILLSSSASSPGEAAIVNPCVTTADNYPFGLASGDGSKTLYLWVKDAAGNIASGSGSITLDTVLPSLANVKVSAITTTSIDVTYTTSELSLTSAYWGTVPATYTANYNVASWATSHTAILQSLASGTEYFFENRLADKAGNAGVYQTGQASTWKFASLTNTIAGANMGAYNPSVHPYAQVAKGIASCDFDGDGYQDVFVGAPHALNGTSMTTGRIYVNFGSASTPATTSVNGDAKIIYEGNTANNKIGAYLDCMDINGDGIGDLVTAHLNTDGTYATPMLFVIVGHAGIKPAVQETRVISIGAGWNLKISNLGRLRAIAHGHLRGPTDAYEDLVLCREAAATTSGCLVIYGSALTNSSAVSKSGDTNFDVRYQHGTIADWAGAGIGDVDGDGNNDLVLGSQQRTGKLGDLPTAGAIMVVRGGALSTVAGTVVDLAVTAPNYTIHGNVTNARIGMIKVADIDGDTYADILAIPSNGANLNSIATIWGRPAGPVAGLDWADDNNLVLVPGTVPTFTRSGDASYDVGMEFMDLKDIDGDGKVDMLMGSSETSGEAGRVCLFQGRPRSEWDALGNSISLSTPNGANVCFDGADAGDNFGAAVAFGNYDSTGGFELIASAPQADGPTDSTGSSGDVVVMYFKLPSINYTKPLVYSLSPHF